MRARLSQLLHPVFQPVVDASGAPIYFEALMRAYGGPKGAHLRLLKVSEEVGFIDEIDCTIAELAIEAGAEAGAAVGVNVSAFTVQNSIDSFLKVLSRRARGQPIVVEMTETLQPDRMDLMDRFVNEVRRLGGKIAVDDFGEGHFEPRDVEIIKPDFLKLAISRVTSLESLPGRQWIAEAVELAAAVGADVVAEGVEADALRGLLRQLGVTAFQGYLWGSPTHLLPRGKHAPGRLAMVEMVGRSTVGYAATPL